jgi:cysteine desulfurase
MNEPIYLDCNATTPLDRDVWAQMRIFFEDEYGNEGSRTHEFGARAKKAVQKSRDQVALLVGCAREEVIFTSGATEANNLSLLGMASFGEQTKRKHIVSTQIEHKAVLEPLEELARRGFEVTLIAPNEGGWIEPAQVMKAVRPDTLLVSVIHANNETGIIQPLEEIIAALSNHSAYLHVDAAQTFGKLIPVLQNSRIDLISISAHKIFGPKGIGALIARRRGFQRPPLRPLQFGGGQERGLRPGTLPVPLIVGFGAAAEIALRDQKSRETKCSEFGEALERALLPLGAKVHGDSSRRLPHVINLSFSGVDSEALIVALKPFVAVSNGSACTSASYKTSHVLAAMKMSAEEIAGAVRWSWCHLTPKVPWEEIGKAILALQSLR